MSYSVIGAGVQLRNTFVDTCQGISDIVQLPDNTYEFLRWCGASIAIANSKLPNPSPAFGKLTNTVNTIKLYTDAMRIWGDITYLFPRLTGEVTYYDKHGNEISEKQAKSDPKSTRVFERKSEFLDDCKNKRIEKITAQFICLFFLDVVSPFYFFQENGGKFADRFFDGLSDLNERIGNMKIFGGQPFEAIKNFNLEHAFRGSIAAVMAGFALHSYNNYKQIQYYEKDKNDPRITDKSIKDIFKKGEKYVAYKKNVAQAEMISNLAESILQSSAFFIDAESLKFQYLIFAKTTLGLATEWMKTNQFQVKSS